MDNFSFEDSKDWFSSNIPLFEKLVLPLQAQAERLNCLEIGTLEGRMPVWLFSHCPSASIVSVDVRFLPALANNLRVAHSRGYDWKFWQGNSLNIPALMRGITTEPYSPFDFIYVDGGHKACEVFSDAAVAFSLLKVGGLLAFDDYLWDVKERPPVRTPKIAIDAFLECYQENITVVHKAYQVWVKKINNKV